MRWDEDGFDRHQIVDQLGLRDVAVEAYRDAGAVVDDVEDALRGTVAGERVDDVRPGERVRQVHDPDHDHDDDDVRVNQEGLRRARVIAVGRNSAWIVFDDESEPQPASLRKTSGPMVVPGDAVEARAIGDGRVVIDTVLPRSFALVRRTGGGRTKTMAANVDTIAIVASLIDPPLNFALIDALIAFAEQHGVEPMLLLTKADLAGEAAADDVAQPYRGLGVPTLLLHPKAGRGIDELRRALAGRHALLVGNSGVGKSSIFRALGGIAVVGELSRAGRGRQTTSSARLARLEDGFLIDSPGIGDFGLDPMPPAELNQLFREMREPSRACRFADCRHLSEPDCAVLEAVASGAIAPSRYASYRGLALGEVDLARPEGRPRL